MSSEFTKLFEPGRIGNMVLRNRFVLAPAGTHSCEPDGRYSQRTIDYYAERARGGTALVILEGHKVEVKLEPRAGFVVSAHSDEYIPGMAEMVEAIHSYGGKACIQLQTDMGRENFGIYTPENPPISASAIPSFWIPSILCRPLEVEEIHEITKAFGAACKRAIYAGFDAIEIHAHTGYLLDQFMSSIWNKRTDEYGGDFEGRMRFTAEIIREARKVVGPNYPLIFRFSAEHKFPGGREIKESQQIAKRLEELGISALHCDAGTYESIFWAAPPNYLGDAPLVDIVGQIKEVVKIPVITVGSLTPETAEAALREGKADFAAFTRQLLADVEMPNKLRDGHREDIRPCILCNEFCIGHVFGNKIVTCAVAGEAGNERLNRLTRAEKSKQIVVIGGGCGGMEAARVAALRGHKVTLFEKSDQLGGLLWVVATPEFKKQLRKLVDWYKIQLAKLNVDVRLNTEINPDSPELKKADHIIVAIGGKSLRPSIPGIDGDNVIDVIDHHLGVKEIKGNRVVVTGGGLSGCDVALELAMEGKEVTLVEMLNGIANDVNFFNKQALNYLLPSHGVKILTGHKVKEFLPNGVLVQTPEGDDMLIEADAAITSFGMTPKKEQAEAIQAKYYDVRIIGDCAKPGRVGDAIRAAFFTTMNI